MSDLLDTNILLRVLTESGSEKAKRCERLLGQAAKGNLRLHVTDVCIAEIAWVLNSFYRMSRRDIADKIVALVRTPGLRFSNVKILLDITERFRAKNVDYVDAHLAAVAAARGASVYSYDRDLDKFEDIRRREP